MIFLEFNKIGRFHNFLFVILTSIVLIGRWNWFFHYLRRRNHYHCLRKRLMLVFDFKQFGFREGETFIRELLTLFHDTIIIRILILILLLVCFLIFLIASLPLTNQNFLNHSLIEVWWILIPLFILLFIGGPSVFLLYKIEDFEGNPKLSIKITGYQWYWLYEKQNLETLNEETIRVYKEINQENEELGIDGLRNLSSTQTIFCEGGVLWRFIVTSGDVMHCWALPSLFLKMDAIPGRLNQVRTALPRRKMVFFGQCRELCGVNHSFIPIVVETTLYS